LRLKRLCEWVLRHRFPAAVVAAGVVLVSPSLFNGLQTDDLTLRGAAHRFSPAEGIRQRPWHPFTFMDGDPAHNHALMDRGWIPWWTYPRVRAAFFRPLTAATHLLDFRVLDKFPILMHVHSLAWFAAMLWVAALLYRRFLGDRYPSWAFALAALLFAFQNGHAMPAGWLANRNAVLSGFFGFLAIIAHDRWRREGWRPGAALAPLALAAALLAKEEAVCVGAYLIAYALFLDRAPRRERLASLVPCALVGIGWYAVYRILGFGVAGAGMYVDPGTAPVRFMARVARSAPVLLLGQWGFPDSDVSPGLSVAAFRILWVWAIVFLAAVAALLAPLVRRDRLARFWVVGMLLSVVPACAPFPHNRLLTFTGLGAMGLLAQWLSGLRMGAAWLPISRAWKRLAGAFAIVFVVLHLILAPLMLPVKATGIAFMGRLIRDHYATLPQGPEVRGQTFVFANALGAAHMLWMADRTLRGEPMPARCLSLSPSSAPVSVTRADERTLVVRPRAGYLLPLGESADPGKPAPAFSLGHFVRFFDVLFRGQDYPMRLGERVELTAATVEVTALTPDGRPAEATFRFRAPLEDRAFRWLMCTPQGRYTDFPLPPVGSAVELPSPLE